MIVARDEGKVMSKVQKFESLMERMDIGGQRKSKSRVKDMGYASKNIGNSTMNEQTSISNDGRMD